VGNALIAVRKTMITSQAEGVTSRQPENCCFTFIPDKLVRASQPDTEQPGRHRRTDA